MDRIATLSWTDINNGQATSSGIVQIIILNNAKTADQILDEWIGNSTIGRVGEVPYNFQNYNCRWSVAIYNTDREIDAEHRKLGIIEDEDIVQGLIPIDTAAILESEYLSKQR